MTRLCDQLKQIYASGDSMTVLKLLKELIDAVEDFEGHTATSEQVGHLTDEVETLKPAVEVNTAKHLYKHEISISYETTSGNKAVYEIRKAMYDNDPDRHTDYYLYGSRLKGASSGFVYIDGFDTRFPVIALEFDASARRLLVIFASNDEGNIAISILPSSITILDTVTQIF